MRRWVQILLFFLFCLVIILTITWNSKTYDKKIEKGQIQAKTYVIE